MLRVTQVLNQQLGATTPKVSKKFTAKFAIPSFDSSVKLTPEEIQMINSAANKKKLLDAVKKAADKIPKKKRDYVYDRADPTEYFKNNPHIENYNHTPKVEPVKLAEIYKSYNPISTLHVSIPGNNKLKKNLKKANFVKDEGITFNPEVFNFLCKPVDFTQMYNTIIRGTKYASVNFTKRIETLEAIQADTSITIPMFVEWVQKNNKKFHAFQLADFAIRLMNTKETTAGALEALLKMYLAIPADMIIRDADIPLHAPDYLKAWFVQVRSRPEDFENEETLKKLRSIQQLDVDLAGLREFYYDVRDSLDNLVIRMYHVLLDKNIKIADEVDLAYMQSLLRSDYSHDAVAIVVNRLIHSDLNSEYLEMILSVIPQVNVSPIVSHLLKIYQLSRGYKTAEETFESLKPETQLALVSAFHRSDVVFNMEVAYQRFRVLLDPEELKKSQFKVFADNMDAPESEFVHTIENRNSHAKALHAARIATGEVDEDAEIDPEVYFAHEKGAITFDEGYIKDSVVDLKNEDHIAEIFGHDLDVYEGETNAEKLEQLFRTAFNSLLDEMPQLRQTLNPNVTLSPKYPISVEQLVDGSPSMYLFGKCVEAGIVPYLSTTSAADWTKDEAVAPLDFTEVSDPCIASTAITHFLYEISSLKAETGLSITQPLTIKLPLDSKYREYYEKVETIKHDILAKDTSVQFLVKTLEKNIRSSDIVSEHTHQLYAAINDRIANIVNESKEAVSLYEGQNPDIIDLKYYEMICRVFKHHSIECETVNGYAIVSPGQLNRFIEMYNA